MDTDDVLGKKPLSWHAAADNIEIKKWYKWSSSWQTGHRREFKRKTGWRSVQPW